MIIDSDRVAEINLLNKDDFFSFLDTFGHQHAFKLESGRYYLHTWAVDAAIEDFLANPNIPDNKRRREQR